MEANTEGAGVGQTQREGVGSMGQTWREDVGSVRQIQWVVVRGVRQTEGEGVGAVLKELSILYSFY
jgi:hypothetical protein